MTMQNSWAYRTRRGKQEQNEDRVVEDKFIEIQHPDETSPMVYRASSSVLPARPLGAPLDTPIITLAIKQEPAETSESSSSVPSSTIKNTFNTEVAYNIQKSVNECRIAVESATGEKTHVPPMNKTIHFEESIDTNNVPHSASGYQSPQRSKSVPDYCVRSLDAFEDNSTTFSYSNRSHEPVVKDGIPPGMSGDLSSCSNDASSRSSRNSSIETILANKHDHTCAPDDHIGIETRINYETLSFLSADKESTGKTTSGILKLTSETTDDVLEITSETASGILKSEPRFSVQDSSVKEMEVCTEAYERGFMNHSPAVNDIPILQPEAPTTQTPISNKCIKTTLLKYMHLYTEINRTNVEDCLNVLNQTYPQTKSFSLFFSDIPSPKSQKRPSDPAAKSTPVDSNTSTAETLISTDELKKIIQFTSLFQNLDSPHLQLPLENCSRDGITASDSENTCMSSETFTPNLRIKTEPSNNCEAPSFVSSSSNIHDAFAIRKRSADEATTKIMKKIKIEPISPPRSALDSAAASTNITKFCERTGEHSSVTHSSRKHGTDLHSQSEHSSIKDSIKWHMPPENIHSNENAISVTENIKRKSSTDSSLIQSNVPQNLSFEEFFNPKIHIKTEPLDDYKTSSSVMCQRAANSSKKSIGETTSEVHQMPIKVKTEPLSLGEDEEKRHTALKVTTNSPLALEKLTSATSNVENNARNISKIRDFSLENFNKTNISSKSGVIEPISSTDLQPRSVTSVRNEASAIESVVQNRDRKLSLSIVPSTSVNSHMPSIPNQTGALIQDINTLLQCNGMQIVEKNNNLRFGENSSDANNTSASDRTGQLSNSPRYSFSNKETIRKKIKLTPEEYLQRKASCHTRDPRLRKSNALNFPSQALSPANGLVQTSILPVSNQQNQNHFPSSHNADGDYKTKCPEAPKVSSNVQMCQESLKKSTTFQVSTGTQPSQLRPFIGNVLHENTLSSTSASRLHGSEISSSVNMGQELLSNCRDLQKPLRTDTKSVKSKAHAPRRSNSKSYYQKTFEARKGNEASTVLRDKVGKTFIEINDLPSLILEWNVSWLQTQKQNHMCPPICDSYPRTTSTYQSILKYYNTYLPLHLLNIWLKIHDFWKSSTTFYNGTLERNKESQNFVKISCSVILNAVDKSNWPKKEDILICSYAKSNNSTKELFGLVVGITERIYFPLQSCPFYKRPGVWTKLHLDILCAENFGVPLLAPIQLHKLFNLKTALKQSEALKCIYSSMRPVVLNPKDQRSLLQVVFLQPFLGPLNIQSNVDYVLRSVLSPKHRVTIAHTQSSDDSYLTIFHVFSHLLRNNSILLICVKDENVFLQLAILLCNHGAILAVHGEDIPRLPSELRKFTVKNCDSEALQSTRIALTLMSAAFFGQLESRLNRLSVICVIHEAQYFSETETALLLSYKMEHLVLVGRPERKSDMHSILVRYGFDLSLFHRCWEVK